MNKLIYFFCFFIFSTFLIHAQWVNQNSIIDSTYLFGDVISALDSSLIVIGGDKGNVLISTDKGKSWTIKSFRLSDADTNETCAGISVLDKNHIWVSTFNKNIILVGGNLLKSSLLNYDQNYPSGRIFASSDGGQTWTVQFKDTLRPVWMSYIKMFDLQNGIAFANYMGWLVSPTNLLKTTNGGQDWEQIDTLNSGVPIFGWRQIDFINTDTGYYFGYGIEPGQQIPKLFKTTNCGVSWDTVNNSDFTYHLSVFNFYDENLGFACDNSYIYSTYDGGKTWNTYSRNENSKCVDIEFISNKDTLTIALATREFIYFSSDTGKTWRRDTSFTKSLGGGPFALCFPDIRTGLALTGYYYVSGLYANDNIQIITGINEIKYYPNEFALYQNYPNPFNPTTNIRFTIPNQGTVTIKIFDILGRELRILLNEEMNAGQHNITFNAKDLPSGIYFYRISAGNYSATKKMVLLK